MQQSIYRKHPADFMTISGDMVCLGMLPAVKAFIGVKSSVAYHDLLSVQVVPYA